MRELAAICADVGVEILPTTATVRAGQTTARSTLQQILENRGEGHVIQLLRTFIETENHRARIDAFALHAISDIMFAAVTTTKQVGANHHATSALRDS